MLCSADLYFDCKPGNCKASKQVGASRRLLSGNTVLCLATAVLSRVSKARHLELACVVAHVVCSLMTMMPAQACCRADEAQFLFMPNFSQDTMKVDKGGARHMRDKAAKMMWTTPSRYLCTIVTGSCLALLWASVGLMPSNGSTLIEMCWRVNLPAECSPARMQGKHALAVASLLQHLAFYAGPLCLDVICSS